MNWNELTFGVEIECYSPLGLSDLARKIAAGSGIECRSVSVGIHSTSSTWKVVHDGSLRAPTVGVHGAEIVSPILQGEAGIAQVIAICAVLEQVGCKVNTTCGLHVHVGAGNATPAQLKNLAKMFVKYEHHFDALCPASRRNSNYAKSNRTQAAGRSGNVTCEYDQVASVFARLEGVRSVRKVAEVMNGGFDQRQHYNHFRYFKLNFQSLNTHGTVEYRQQAGTVNGAKISAWVKTVAQFTAQSFTLRTVASSTEPTFAKMMKKLDRTTAEFMTARRARLNIAA